MAADPACLKLCFGGCVAAAIEFGPFAPEFYVICCVACEIACDPATLQASDGETYEQVYNVYEEEPDQVAEES